MRRVMPEPWDIFVGAILALGILALLLALRVVPPPWMGLLR